MQTDKFTKASLMVVIVLLVLNLWVMLQRPAQSSPAGGVQYKAAGLYYKVTIERTVFDVNKENIDENVTSWLNKQAAQGWRLIAVAPTTQYGEPYKFFFTK